MMDLQTRMRMTATGQVTWADPEKNNYARCDACRHFAMPPDQKKGVSKGRCGLVNAFTRKQGVLFDGAEALACGKFERGQA